MESAIVLALWVVFVPLAVLVAWRLAPTFLPPRRRPFLFLAGFIFLAGLGVSAALGVQDFIHSGEFHLASRRLGNLQYSVAQQPMQYWTAIVVWYSLAVFLVGCGLVSAHLCFRRQQGAP